MSTLPKEVEKNEWSYFRFPKCVYIAKGYDTKREDVWEGEAVNIDVLLASELEQRDKRAAEIVRALGHNPLCASEDNEVEPPNECDCWLGKTIQAILNPQ